MVVRKSLGIDLVLTLVVGTCLFAVGYYYGSRSTSKALDRLGLGAQDVARDSTQRMLMDAAGRARLINLMDNHQDQEVEKRLLSAMVMYLDAVHLDSVRCTALAHDKAMVLHVAQVNAEKWRKDISEIRDCAVRKDLPKSVKQADEILQWLDKGN